MRDGYGLFISSPLEDTDDDGPWSRLMRYAHSNVVYLLPDSLEKPSNIAEMRREVKRFFAHERRAIVVLSSQRHPQAFIDAALAYRAEISNEDE